MAASRLVPFGIDANIDADHDKLLNDLTPVGSRIHIELTAVDLGETDIKKWLRNSPSASPKPSLTT